MTRAPQKRRLETRAALLREAEGLILENGFSALRVEDVVERAGVAKGTLFSHFKDKDGLLAVLIGARVMALMDEMEAQPSPEDVEDLCDLLSPLLCFIAQDRVVFDILLRYSGSTSAVIDETVTQSFHRQINQLSAWISVLQNTGQIRQDAAPELLAEGIQAFLNHVLALWFCVDHENGETPSSALLPLLQTWLAAPA
ncbi:transcriptional regulator, TetR family protein [Roseobacter sp. SK209-2-6]|uniref:TetR/AcrR family transcriptional regulator n=1 Tax=Roseobacter sp. SK209-2-6 TaxID=388739 RepID=UPI0000F3D1AA|nr:TetR/AcrR family transcriptional regulator [Roseobacter sp. SK209-2-6]EBA17129.1 transcriptional regulator, TetR family protein [Roseobacter sp. SK209-2-6]